MNSCRDYLQMGGEGGGVEGEGRLLLLLLFLLLSLLFLLLLCLHPRGPHSAPSPYEATEFTRYHSGLSKRPSVRASSFGFLSPSLAGPRLGKRACDGSQGGPSWPWRKRRSGGKGEGGVRAYIGSAAGRGGGAGKEGTLLLLLIAAVVAIAATSVGWSRDNPTTPILTVSPTLSPVSVCVPTRRRSFSRG